MQCLVNSYMYRYSSDDAVLWWSTKTKHRAEVVVVFLMALFDIWPDPVSNSDVWKIGILKISEPIFERLEMHRNESEMNRNS